MELTRVDTTQLRDAVTEARALITRLRTLFEPLLVTALTDDERKQVVRAPLRLPEAARALALAAETRPELAKGAGFDRHAVLEDLDNTELLAGLAEAFRELTQWVDDSQLVWNGEAYRQSLDLYNVARALSGGDGSLRPLIGPLADVFQARKRPSREEAA